MAFSLTVHNVQQYTTNVKMLLQQMPAKLPEKVTRGSYTGKAAKAVEQIGKARAQKRVGRNLDTPNFDMPGDARWIYPTDYEWGTLIDDQDKLRMLIDPQGPYALQAATAMRRAQDDEIMAAFYAGSKTGENGSTTTSFPAGQQVGVNTGGTASNMNVAKLRAGKRILMANGVDLESEPVYCMITSSEHDALLNETQVINLDYNTRPVLVDGRVTSFMGVNFVQAEFSNTDFPLASAASGGLMSSTTRLCPMWVPSGMHFGSWDEISINVDTRPDKSYATGIYVKGTFGATRLEEGRVVQIACA